MIRKLMAILCGILAGSMLLNAISSGLAYRFTGDLHPDEWGLLIWDDHWFLRAVASLISAAWAGFITGVIARDKGETLAIIALLPSWIFWVLSEYLAFGLSIPFMEDFYIGYVSLGYKISIGVIILCMLPISWFSGKFGEEVGKEYASHYDSRPRTILGIMWYHYLWIPPFLYIILTQATYAGFYFLLWVESFWRSQLHGLSFLPMIFTAILYGTLYFMFQGLMNAYLILAGFTEYPSKWKATLHILKYGFGFPTLATIVQQLIQIIHFKILS